MTVALKNKPPVVVPAAALRRAGFKRGQVLEVKSADGVVTIVPKEEDDYTPAERRAIDRGIAQSEKGGNYLEGKNPTAVPGFSNTFGLGTLDSTNTAILSNSNGWLNALTGDVDQDQVDTANAIYKAADSAGLFVDVFTHSNGVNGAAAFAPGKTIGTAVVVAPNTRSTEAMMNIVNASSHTTILQSENDFALNIPGAAHKSPSAWARIFKGNPKVTVKPTTQSGHRLTPYRKATENKTGVCAAEFQTCP